jgi:hypothetical protein
VVLSALLGVAGVAQGSDSLDTFRGRPVELRFGVDTVRSWEGSCVVVLRKGRIVGARLLRGARDETIEDATIVEGNADSLHLFLVTQGGAGEGYAQMWIDRRTVETIAKSRESGPWIPKPSREAAEVGRMMGLVALGTVGLALAGIAILYIIVFHPSLASRL